jgi:Questin oxidase-like
MGCGLEFHQPALIVEALAETAVSVSRMGNFLSFIEEKAISAGNPNTKSLVQIIQEVGLDEKILSVVRWDEPNKLGNGPDKKAKEELADHSKDWGVGPGQLKEKMAELINGAGLYPPSY